LSTNCVYVCVCVQGTRMANEVVIMTVHDIGSDREYYYVK